MFTRKRTSRRRKNRPCKRYRQVTVRDAQGQVQRLYEHQLVALETFAPLFVGRVIHHRDGNRLNNDPRNLLPLESQSEHARLEAILQKVASGVTLLFPLAAYLEREQSPPPALTSLEPEALLDDGTLQPPLFAEH